MNMNMHEYEKEYVYGRGYLRHALLLYSVHCTAIDPILVKAALNWQNIISMFLLYMS